MFFKQFKAVFKNSFKVCSGDSFYLVISLTMLAAMSLAASMPSIGNEHTRLVRDQTHSILFICGALATAFGLIRVVTDDIRRGSGAVLMSRPISGAVLIAGKLCGVLACTGMLVISGAAAITWISEINHHSEMVEMGSFIMYIIAVFASLGVGAGRQYMSGANFSKGSTVSLMFFLCAGVTLRYFTAAGAHFDFTGLKSVALLFLALAVFASIVLVVAVIADSAIVLGVSILIFFFGLLAEYLCSVVLGGELGGILVAVLPNWQMFWILEKIGMGHEIPLVYFFKCGIHAFLLCFMYTNIAVMFFDKSEIKGVA